MVLPCPQGAESRDGRVSKTAGVEEELSLNTDRHAYCFSHYVLARQLSWWPRYLVNREHLFQSVHKPCSMSICKNGAGCEQGRRFARCLAGQERKGFKVKLRAHEGPL